MSFLQPAMLFALPVIALPIIIHLINQRRFQTIRWAAMNFLLAANRMSRGYARLRQWLILLARTLAVAGLIFAVSRPLSSGWLGLAGGARVDTTLILFDRSPSMLQQNIANGRSKLASGRDQLVRSLSMLRSNHWVLIDSANNKPIELKSPDSLAELPETEGVSAAADLPAMLQTAHDYIRQNRPSWTEVWICSDVRQNDWNADSGRWQVLRDSFLEYPQTVRFHLLAYPEQSPQNRTIRVTSVRRVAGSSGAALLLSLRLEQDAPVDDKVSVPIHLEIDGARSEIRAEMTGSEFELKDHQIPLDARQIRGWGRVSIPADANPTDNEFYFVYDEPAPRKTLVVADNPDAVRVLELAAAISPDPAITCAVETLGPDQLAGVAWEELSLILWQAPLPDESMAKELQTFLDRGGQLMFFPPDNPTNTEFAGLKWGNWQEVNDGVPVTTWIGDQGLLANARSGVALPVGQLQVWRYCELEGDQISLATLQGGRPLLCRTISGNQPVYFCTTSTSAAESSLARDGVVLYVMLQRALASGAESLGAARQYVAGELASTTAADWKQLAGKPEALSTAYTLQSGVYQQGDKLLAVNRSELEDRSATLTDTRVAGLFDRLEFDRIDDRAGSGSSLIQEIWRLFLALMLVALFAEACLCVPRAAPKPQASLTSTSSTAESFAEGAAA